MHRWITKKGTAPFSNRLPTGGIVTLAASGVTPNYPRFTENARDLQSPNMTENPHPPNTLYGGRM